jgi:hypothetical protein
LHSKDYREGDSAVKKTLSDLALPLHVADELLGKCSHHVNLIRYTIKCTILLLLLLKKIIIRVEGARWLRGQCTRHAIAEVKQRSQWSVMGWVTKIYYLELLRA